MKNVRQCSDKQQYQLCTGRASLQLSLFRPNSNTHRQVQFICNFLFFPVICSRWECSLLCVLTACVQHALVLCSKVRQKAKAFILAAAAVPLLCKLYFCRGVKGNGKGAEQRIARAGQCSLLAYFGCFYFGFLATGISLPPLTDWQQNPRLPHLILTVTADAVTCLPGCCL